jgi:hypothetical protein
MMKKITLTCTALVALFSANVGAAGSTNYATTAEQVLKPPRRSILLVKLLPAPA